MSRRVGQVSAGPRGDTTRPTPSRGPRKPPPPPPTDDVIVNVEDVSDDDDDDGEVTLKGLDGRMLVVSPSPAAGQTGSPSKGGPRRRATLKRRQTSPAKCGGGAAAASKQLCGQNFRDIFLKQMSLLKEREADLAAKTRQLKTLQDENDKLRKKIRAIEFVRKVDKAVGTSENVSVANAVMPTLEPQVAKTPPKKAKKKAAEQNSVDFAWAKPYFLLRGESLVEAEKKDVAKILHYAETPQWRHTSNPRSRHHHDHETEDVSDEAFGRRHLKLEQDEKRRKRWDMQRMREQRTVQRLKAYHERRERGWAAVGPLPAEEENEEPVSLLPAAEAMEAIQVGLKEVPLTAFGAQLPDEKGIRGRAGREFSF